MFKLITIFMFVVMLLPQTVAADKKQAAKLYEDAVIRLNDKDTKGAIIQLKNALKQDSDLLAARILLGKSYLLDGQPVSAESELLNAQRLGADPAHTQPLLAEIYLLQHKYQNLLKSINIDTVPNPVKAQLLIYIGHAQLKLGQLEQADESFSKSNQFTSSADAISGKALVLLHQGKLDASRAMLNKAILLDSEKASIWSVKASISHLEGKLEQAKTEYGKALLLDEKDLDSRLALIGILLDQDNRPTAKTNIDYLRQEYPYEPRAIYLDSVLSRREGDTNSALESLRKAAEIITDIDPAILNNSRALLMLAGMVFYDLKQYEQAIIHLDVFVKKHPEFVGARKILGLIYLEQRELEKSIAILEPAYQLAPNDPRVMTLLGKAYSETGNADQAIELLEKAAVFSYEKTAIRTDLAIGYLNAGEQKLALKELIAIYEKDNTQTSTGMVLALAYYQLGQLDKALSLAEELMIKEPDNVVFLNWGGSIQAANGLFDKARQSFEKALTLNSNLMITRINLGKLLLAEGKTEKAKQYYQSILEQQPNHIATLIESARVEEFQGNYQKAIHIIKNVINLSKDNITARSYLVELYGLSGQTEDAYLMAEEILELTPGNMDSHLLVVSTALATGKVDDARLSFRRMKDYVLTDAESLFRIARAELQSGFLKDGIATMSLSLHYRPDYVPAQMILLESLLKDRQTELAKDWAIKIKTTHPELAKSYRLMGDVLMQEQQVKKARTEYVEAFSREPTSVHVLRLYQAMAANNEIEQGVKLLTDWLNTRPEDNEVRYSLSGAYFQLKQYKLAQTNLEKILQNSPDQPELLNNLANLYFLTNDQRALETAKRALELDPDNPSINDTIGWLLVQNGNAEQGLQYLREAYFRKGNDLEIRYHIAVALHQLNRNNESLQELNQILSLKQDFKDIDAARTLLKQLEKH